jgi:hypothetical protein
MKTGDLGINSQQCKPFSVLYTTVDPLRGAPSTLPTGTEAHSSQVKWWIFRRLSTNAHLPPVEDNCGRRFYSQCLFIVNCAVYEITWKNSVQPDRPQMTIWRMRVACWLTKATNTLSEYVIIIVFFSLRQWLHERVSMLRYTYIACHDFSSAISFILTFCNSIFSFSVADWKFNGV